MFPWVQLAKEQNHFETDKLKVTFEAHKIERKKERMRDDCCRRKRIISVNQSFSVGLCMYVEKICCSEDEENTATATTREGALTTPHLTSPSPHHVCVCVKEYAMHK